MAEAILMLPLCLTPSHSCLTEEFLYLSGTLSLVAATQGTPLDHMALVGS